jgi:alpha-methylacyl-CoA racemase
MQEKETIVSGPLSGLRVLELGGKGPAPFCGMVLADLGAEVIRLERPGEVGNRTLNRSRRSVVLNLKSDEGRSAALRIAARSDIVLEGFRPGVIERLGLGPDTLLEQNPSIVLGRMTGWGQDGPWAQAPGHDINYIAATGVLHSIGSSGGPPVVPLNLIGDFGGGGMLLAVGVLAALTEARVSGRGQVVDAAMTDGSALLMAMTYGFLADGMWDESRRGLNRLDGGRPFYGVYECADGYLAVGCVETPFWNDFLTVLGLEDDPDFARQLDEKTWPNMKERLSQLFRLKTRAQWEEAFPMGRACVNPVLSMAESFEHEHNVGRGTFGPNPSGGHWPMPAPRFSRTGNAEPRPISEAGADTLTVLEETGLTREEIEQLMDVAR